MELLRENERNHLDPGDMCNHPNETSAEKQQELRNKILFTLYTKANKTCGERLYVGDVDALKKSNFHFSKPTIFITHGWLYNVAPITLIRDGESLLYTIYCKYLSTVSSK